MGSGLDEIGRCKPRKDIGLIILAVLTLSVAHAPVVFPGWFGTNWVAPWNANNWLVSWENGFVTRGLVGSLMLKLHGGVALKHVLLWGICSVVLYLAVLTWLALRLYSKAPGFGMLMLVLFFLVQPCSVQWWLSPAMFARLDIFLVLALLGSLVCLEAIKTWKKYLILLPLSLAAMLVHEGFAVLFVPVIFALAVARHVWRGQQMDLTPWAFYLIPVLVLWGVMVSLGKPQLPYESFVAVLQARAVDFDVIGDGFVRLAYYMPLAERIKTITQCLTWDMWLRIGLTLVVMAPSWLIVIMMWVKAWSVIGEERWGRGGLALVILSVFSPLLAFVLGCDFFRWMEYCLFNNIICLGVLAYGHGEVRAAMVDVMNRQKSFVLMVLVMNSTVGVPGVVISYPIVELILQLLHRSVS